MYYFRLLLWLLGIAAVVLIAVAIFGGGKKTPVNPVKPLPDYASTNATVSFTEDGIVNGDELHRQIRITVSQNQRTLDVIQGYSGQVIQTNSFENNQNAYSVFLKSINNEGFLDKNKDSKIPSDEQGQCPQGYRYVLDLNQGGKDLSRTWASTCGSSVGNSKAVIQVVQALFQNQIPNFQNLTSQVDLSATSTQ